MPIPKYAVAHPDNTVTPSPNVPSYATLNNSSPSPENSGILNDILEAGGTAGRAIGYGLGDVINAPVEAANYANQKLAGLFGIKPENVPTPQPFNPQAFPMPGVSQQAQQSLDPLARGLATSAELAAPALDTSKLAALGGKEGLKFLQNKLGLAAKQKANNLVGDLLNGNNFSNSHLPVLNELRSNYNDVQKASNAQYNDILNQANQAGYTGSKQFPGISVATNEKTIIPNDFQNEVSDIDLDAHSKDVQNLLKPFQNSVNNNLSFSDAHNLQSELGKQGAKLNTSTDGTQRYLGGQLLGLRDTLKNDITGSLSQNGDTDLANQYQDASNFFKNNVAPYRENPTIRKVVMGSGLKEVNPANIGNVLKKDDGAILPIAGNLSDQSKNLLLANELKSATQKLPDKNGQLQMATNPQDLINAYGNLDNKGLEYLRTPESQAKIASIMGDLSRQSKLKWASGLAVPAALGAFGAKHI